MGGRLEFPVSYVVVYILVVLGTFLVSTLDLMSMAHALESAEHKCELLFGVGKETGPYSSQSDTQLLADQNIASKLAQRTRKYGLHHDHECLADQGRDRRKNIESYMVTGLNRGFLESGDIVQLALELLEEKDFNSPKLTRWLHMHPGPHCVN